MTPLPWSLAASVISPPERRGSFGGFKPSFRDSSVRFFSVRVPRTEIFVTSNSQTRLDYVPTKVSLGWIMYRLNHNHDIIDLLVRLRELRADYPVELFFTRRLLFIRLVGRCVRGIIRS